MVDTVRPPAAKRPNPVATAQRSDAALTKAARKRAAEDYPVHSFTSLLADLATICANQIQPADDMPAFTKITSPTPLQRRAFELLGISHRLRAHVGNRRATKSVGAHGAASSAARQPR